MLDLTDVLILKIPALEIAGPLTAAKDTAIVVARRFKDVNPAKVNPAAVHYLPLKPDGSLDADAKARVQQLHQTIGEVHQWPGAPVVLPAILSP